MRILTLSFVLVSLSPVLAAPPTVVDPNLKLELVAEAPDIVTPTGIAVDAKGRIWCLENHTHQRGSEYKGPPTDRVRVFEDFDANGKARKTWTFADGFRDSMGLTFAEDGSLYIATRAKIFRLTAREDKETSRTAIVTLETKGNYPHNGLCGFTWDVSGDLIFGLGENLGESYKLIGSDSSTLTGGGEGGSMYRCRPDGSNVRRIATGFWNPFAHCFDARGNLFMVDNDPDARGPCRLIHVIEGGDYGYRFRYGRKGTHPFQAWNGELPGTLPMVAGTSEAPSGVIAGDFTSLPVSYHGKLLITSWGDHTVEAFTLSPRGASFSATSKVVVRGDENFRPVNTTIAPDGSVVFADWVDKSYPVHGKGRIWRLRAKTPFSGKPKAPAQSVAAHSTIAQLGDADPFVVGAALAAHGRPGNSPELLRALAAKPQAGQRLGMLLALRRTGDVDARSAIPGFLADADPAIRRAAIQWIAEDRLSEHKNQLLYAACELPVSRELFVAWRAAHAMFDGKDPAAKDLSGEDQVAALLKDKNRPVVIRLPALQVLRADHPSLSPGLLGELFAPEDLDMRRAVLRTLLVRADADAQALLRQFVLDAGLAKELRALAVTGLGQSAETTQTREVLEDAVMHVALRADAERSLGRRAAEPKRSAEEWKIRLVAERGDAAAGERIFYQSRGAGCYKCHTVDNRGGAVGPDLSFIARSSNREKFIESILEPSKEIAPMYTSYRVLTRDGKERVGLWLGETFDSLVMLGDAQGKVEKIHRREIEERSALKQSIMPDDLANQMTAREFADLLAFLMERK